MKFCSALVLSYVAIAAATLQPQTLSGWQTYVLATEKRIERELSMDVSKAAEVRNALRGGTIYIERMRTLDDNGREIQVQDGMIHHWYGAIFVPSIALDPLLRWLQDYDHH